MLRTIWIQIVHVKDLPVGYSIQCVCIKLDSNILDLSVTLKLIHPMDECYAWTYHFEDSSVNKTIYHRKGK